MLQHENPHIEIINKNLWAVRFSTIPMIPQISYKPDPTVPLEALPGQLTPDGIIILNKDYKFHEKTRKIALTALTLNNRVIQKELADLEKYPTNNMVQVLYYFCLNMVQAQREIKKGGTAHGHNR